MTTILQNYTFQSFNIQNQQCHHIQNQNRLISNCQVPPAFPDEDCLLQAFTGFLSQKQDSTYFFVEQLLQCDMPFSRKNCQNA